MSSQQPSRVEPEIWQCYAGSSVKIPKLHSHVYYFPLGHLEHVSPSPNPNTLALVDRSRQFIPCTISAVDLLADPHTDEVFVKLLLTPVTNNGVHEPQSPEVREDQDDGKKVVSYTKTLTPSDANNGGAFSVPVECAKLIFPPLDLDTEKPSQELSISDIHGKVWKFRHVYRGTPLRHLLTTDWSEFVDKKKLVGGDSLVFMKDSDGNISVGVHRQTKFGAAAKITEKSFTEAVELADKNMAFEIVYYPTAKGWCNFVVDVKVVEDAMNINWNLGGRIELSLKNYDSSKRCSKFEGTISALSAPNRPWRMLEVKWDEPKVSQVPERVSPWEVETISDIFALHPQFHPTKKLRKSDQDSAAVSDKKGDFFVPNIEDFLKMVPNIEFKHFVMTSSNQTLLNNDAFLDGMQGARHRLFSTSTSSNFVNDKSNGFLGNNSTAVLSNVSSEPHTAGPISLDLSPHSHDISNSLGTKISGTDNSNTKKVSPGSFMLFGKIIKPAGSDFQELDIMGNDDCKGSNEIEGIKLPQKELNRLCESSYADN